MNQNEQLLQKLRDFRMEKMIELKNENPDIEVDIEDVIYCGQMDFEINGEIAKKDVFLVVKNIDGAIKMEYHIENDLIAIDYNDMIIPTEDYQKTDFKPLIKNEDKRVSLNQLEEERINNISGTLGMNNKDIKASCEIDSKNLNEEQLLRKYVNVKSEFDPNRKITASESFGNIIPEASKFSKIAVVYSDKTSDKFKLVGITNEGKVEEIEELVQTEGTNPTENVIGSNRDGSEVESKTVQAMYKIKGRQNEGFTMNIGSAGCIEVNYVRRSTDDEYLSIPIEATHTRPVSSELKRDMDKSKNVRVDEEIDRAQDEFEDNNETNWKNIDDNPNNHIKEINFEEEAEKAKVSVEEFKRIYEEQSEDLSPEERIEEVHQEIEDQYIGRKDR